MGPRGILGVMEMRKTVTLPREFSLTMKFVTCHSCEKFNICAMKITCSNHSNLEH